MNVIACPFDLKLWTGIENGPISDEKIYTRFKERRDIVRNLSQWLSRNSIQDCVLRIPLTQRLYEQLSNIPPWSEVRKGSHLYRLKRDVLALLRNKQDAAGLTLYVDVSEVEHLYTWKEPDGFFPQELVSMQESWVEMVGVCAFEDALSARGFDQPVPLLGCCIVTASADASEAQVTRQSIANEAPADEEQGIPLLSGENRAWRRYIWVDERLPLGPIGYCPPKHWHFGSRPRHYKHCYRDALGGLWEWDGERKHWDVQLPDASVKHSWVDWIEKCTDRLIRTRPDLITHINVAPDGNIDHKTFEWCD